MASPETPPAPDPKPESSPDSKITMAPEPFTPEESSHISEQWATLKESVNWKDVILHPVARLSIFWHERQTAQADMQLEDWKREEAETMSAMASTRSGLEKSDSIQESLRLAQKKAGIVLDQKRYGTDQKKAGIIKADLFQETRTENLKFVQEKIRTIEEKKKSFMQERDVARKVFIDSYAAKVAIEAIRVAQCDEHINEATGKIIESQQRGEELKSLREYLEAQNQAELLPHDAAELRETINQLRLKESEYDVQFEQDTAQLETLNIGRDDAIKQQEFWAAKITPKSKEMPEVVLPASTPEMPKKEEEAPEKTPKAVSEVAPKPTPDNTSVTEKSEEAGPKSLGEAVKGFRRGLEEAPKEEQEYMADLLGEAQTKYQEKYPESKVFTWFMWFFEFFSDSVKEKQKTPK